MFLDRRLFSVPVFLMICALFVSGCSQDPGYEEILRGSWRMRVASIHTVITFKANGSWQEIKKVEGELSRIIKRKNIVEGEWDIEKSPDGKDLFFVVITPTLIQSAESSWVKGEKVYMEIVEVSDNLLVLKGKDGGAATWHRLRARGQAGGEDVGQVKISLGSMVVNLVKERRYQKDRYLCLDLDVELEDMEGIDFVKGGQPDGAGFVTYSAHPRIREAAVLYLSSLNYRETKNLDKVKKIIQELKTILNPYFLNKISKLNVKKVIVTANVENVEEFEKEAKEAAKKKKS